MNTIVRDYPTWEAYRAELAKLDPSAYIDDAAWAGGVANVGEALALADHGWQGGMEYIQRIAMPLVGEISGMMEHVDLTPDVCGAAFDVGEYLAGTPECWVNPCHTAAKPCVSIAANIVSSAGIPAENLKRRGAAIVALTLALQGSGYAVRVYAVEGMRPGFRSDVWTRVCLTDEAGGPLDTDRLLFALAHPGAARHLGYILGNRLAGMPDSNGSIGWALDDNSGRGTHGPDGWTADFELEAPHFNDADWRSDEAVSLWVAQAYEKITNRENA